MGDLIRYITDIDTDLLLLINGSHTPVADAFMYLFSSKLVWIPMYASLLFVLWKNLSWPQLIGCLLAVALTIVLADQVCSSVIRPLVGRYRPANANSPIADLVHIVAGHRGGRSSFPSCHAANTFGLAFFAYYVVRRRVLTLFFVIWALLTCYSRAYLGLHYPGDLLVGALIGYLAASLSYWLLVKIAKYKPVKRVSYANLPIWVGSLTTLVLLLAAPVLEV